MDSAFIEEAETRLKPCSTSLIFSALIPAVSLKFLNSSVICDSRKSFAFLVIPPIAQPL